MKWKRTLSTWADPEWLRTDLERLHRVPEVLLTLQQIEADPVAAVAYFGPAVVAWAAGVRAEEEARGLVRPAVPLGFTRARGRQKHPRGSGERMRQVRAALASRGITPFDGLSADLKREIAAEIGTSSDNIRSVLSHLRALAREAESLGDCWLLSQQPSEANPDGGTSAP